VGLKKCIISLGTIHFGISNFRFTLCWIDSRREAILLIGDINLTYLLCSFDFNCNHKRIAARNSQLLAIIRFKEIEKNFYCLIQLISHRYLLARMAIMDPKDIHYFIHLLKMMNTIFILIIINNIVAIHVVGAIIL